MGSAVAVVLRRLEPRAVIMVEHEMLTLITNHIRNSLQVLCVLRDHERTRVQRNDHSGGIHVSTLIEHSPRILSDRYLNIRRILALVIGGAVRPAYIDRVIRVIQPPAVAVLSGNRKKVRQP